MLSEELYTKSYVFDTEKCELEIMDTSGDDSHEALRPKVRFLH